MLRKGWMVGVLLAALSGPAVAESTAAMLLYQVTEPGLEPYTSRIIVTPAYLRLDDGVDKGDFVLFDRASKVIYGVTRNDRTVLEIHPRKVTEESPLPLKMSDELVAAGSTPPPRVGGIVPQHHRLNVNGEVCYETMTVSGLLDDAVAALRAYRTVLAGENARILPQVPADMNDPCDLALNTFAPEWQLKFGLPIQEWDPQGKGQQLMDYNAHYPVEPALFALPKGFEHYTPEKLP